MNLFLIKMISPYFGPDTRTASINSSNLIIQATIKATWPDADVHEKDFSGITVTRGKHKIDFYRKARKYHHHAKNRWKDLGKGNFSDEVIKVLKGFSAEKTIVINPSAKVVELDDKGAQACIDHIQKKLETFLKVHPYKGQSETSFMLKNLISELIQYL